MKMLLMGDIHGNLEALEACLTTTEKEGIDRINVLGDIVGYMANPNECVKSVMSMDCISGNHDAAVFDNTELSKFNPFALKALVWTREQLTEDNITFIKTLPSYKTYCSENCTIAHGSLIDPFMYIEYESQVRINARFMPTDLLFVGHTHVPAMWSISGSSRPFTRSHQKIKEVPVEFDCDVKLDNSNKYIINIGSVGQPRDYNPKGCCVIYDTDAYSIRFVRFQYDVEKTIQKIKLNKLPDFLHMRLLNGE
jgi:predicted phosphodiesterase